MINFINSDIPGTLRITYDASQADTSATRVNVITAGTTINYNTTNVLSSNIVNVMIGGGSIIPQTSIVTLTSMTSKVVKFVDKSSNGSSFVINTIGIPQNSALTINGDGQSTLTINNGSDKIVCNNNSISIDNYGIILFAGIKSIILNTSSDVDINAVSVLNFTLNINETNANTINVITKTIPITNALIINGNDKTIINVNSSIKNAITINSSNLTIDNYGAITLNEITKLVLNTIATSININTIYTDTNVNIIGNNTNKSTIAINQDGIDNVTLSINGNKLTDITIDFNDTLNLISYIEDTIKITNGTITIDNANLVTLNAHNNISLTSVDNPLTIVNLLTNENIIGVINSVFENTNIIINDKAGFAIIYTEGVNIPLNSSIEVNGINNGKCTTTVIYNANKNYIVQTGSIHYGTISQQNHGLVVYKHIYEVIPSNILVYLKVQQTPDCGPIPVGSIQNFTVEAVDQFNRRIESYDGTVIITTSATKYSIDPPIIKLNNGYAFFTMKFGKEGSWSVNASYSSDNTIIGGIDVIVEAFDDCD